MIKLNFTAKHAMWICIFFAILSFFGVEAKSVQLQYVEVWGILAVVAALANLAEVIKKGKE